MENNDDNKDESDDGGTPRATKEEKKDTEDESVENADDMITLKERKWSKYSKRYKPQWEKLEVFANWLQRTPESLLLLGKPEAFCSCCQQCLRAHKSDLLAHAKSKKHKAAEKLEMERPKDCKSFVETYMPDVEDQAKIDLPNEEGKVPSPIRTRGRPSQQSVNKTAIIEQIDAEMEETIEKIKVCEEELNNLRVKKARLENEMAFYRTNN